MKTRIGLFIISLAVCALAAEPSSDMAQVVRAFQADQTNVARSYDLPWSEAQFDRVERLSKEWQERLAKMNFDVLDPAGRLDHLLLQNKLAAQLNEIAIQHRRLGQMKELLPFRRAVQELEETRWRMETLSGQASAGKIAGLQDQIKALRERIKQGTKPQEKPKDTTEPAKKPDTTATAKQKTAPPLKVPPALAARAAAATDEIRGTLKKWFGYYDGYQPEFSWWLRKPYDDASKALEDYAKFLREEIAGVKGKDEDPLLGEPVGAAVIAQTLRTEWIPYSAEELIAIGEREFAWCEAEMKKAARDMGCGDDWKAALEKVKGDFLPPGQQETLVAEVGREAIRFVRERKLVTVPPLCEEVWRLSMIPPKTQKTIPYASYGGQQVNVAYASAEMKHEDKLMAMRGNNRHFMRIVTPHELVPGHHLQAFMAERQREYRRLFWTPFFGEGWALYWETVLWDNGWLQTPQDRIGALFWRMHRCARIIVSLKFHLGKMKPVEMVGFLINRVGHERLGATSEVRRYISDGVPPLYQCAYMTGALQLRALHREIVGAGKMTEREFNDKLLTYGPIPIELIRADLLNLPLASDAKASWRFAEKR